MWIHIVIFLCFCVLFCFTKGLFSRSSQFLAGKLPSFFQLNSGQVRIILLCIFWGNVLGMSVTAVNVMTKDAYTIKRQEETFTEEWFVSDGKNKEKIDVEVRTRPYTNSEKIALLEDAVQQLEELILGDNDSLNRVEYPLNLLTEYPDAGILIEWDTNKPLVLDWEGQIGNDIPEEGTEVELRAELILDEYRRSFSKVIVVFPEKIEDSQQLILDVQKTLEEKNKQQGQYLHLPRSVNGQELSWEKANHFHGVLLTVFVGVMGVLIVLSGNSREKEAKEKYLMEMQRDYPGILSKMLLFMQAGFSSRRALQKIAMDYKLDLKRGRPSRAGYEEILRMHKELEQGISEETVYRNLGSRSTLLSYRTFSTLLIQNLKKGSSYFMSALKQECSNAFEERKSQALIMGEKAGTKLLLPMGGMLLIVLLIILVPSMMAIG